MKKFNIYFLSIFMLIIISSCGKNMKNDNKVILRFSAPGFMLYNKIRESVGKEFEKIHPEVKVIYEPVSGQSFFDKLKTQMASKTEPDIFFMRDFELPYFVSKNTILSLNKFIKEDKNFNLKDFHKSLIEAYTINGKIYGLPGSFTTGVIYYNKNLFSKYDINTSLSLSWKKLIEIGKKLTIIQNGITRQFGLVLEYYDWITFILQNNGKLFTKDGKKCIINSRESLEAIRFLKFLITKYKIVPSTSDLQQSSAYQIFMLGRGAMFTGGRWFTTIFREIKTFKWGIMPFFYGKRKATRLDSHSWVISKNCKNPELAWEFLKFLTSPSVNWKMVEVGDSVPVHKSNVKKFLQLFPDNKVFIDSLKYAYTSDKVMSPYISWSLMNNIMNEEFEKYLLNKESGKDALANIQKRIQKAIDENIKEE